MVKYYRAQDIVESTLPRISGTLSILGSSAIILSMIIDGRKLKSSFNRLLFMLCVFDIFTSSGCVWSSSALPKDDNYHFHGAQGNWITCRMHGFILQLGTAVPFYFLFLTIHYLLVIRYGMKEERIRRTFEPFMHLFASGFAITTATAGLILKIFNPDGNACWITEHPRGCINDDSDVDCIYGANATIYRFIFGGFPTVLPLVLVPLIMGLIFWTVRKQTLKMERYSPNNRFHAAISTTCRSSSSRQSATGDVSSTLSSISNLRRKVKCKTTERLKAVAHQGLAYTFCYLIVYVWPIIMVLFMIYTEDKNVPLSTIALYNLFYPLQGFLNYLVHIRPFVVQMRKRHSEMSILRAMLEVTFPKRPERRRNSVCHELNCCFRKRDECKNSQSITGTREYRSEEKGADSDQDDCKDCDWLEKGLDSEEGEEDNVQQDILESSVEEEEALVAALKRAASYKSEQGSDTEEQEINQENEYFQAIAELSKITGNYS